MKSIKNITKKGILVVLASGKPRKYTEDISKYCYASKYVITSNGGNIYDYESKTDMYLNIMDKEACTTLYNIAMKNNVRYIMNVGDVRVVSCLKFFDGTETKLETNIEEFVRSNAIVQCTIADSSFNKIKKIKSDIQKIKNVEIKNQHKSLIDSSVLPEGTIYYDIANIESSKGLAVEKLCNMLNIDIKDSIAIGDDYNDISMFKKVGYSVVMGNANDNVKKYANEVINSNDENGVAIFLENL
ncbi:MAG: HAD-IIB family hydrolase [Clostridia bacterium]